jgi:membrane protein DedA with SNARE-associated domain
MHPESINRYIETYGSVAIFLLMFSNGIISTPPSEVVLAAAGAMASLGYGSLLSASSSAITGNLAGALALYFLGRSLGYSWVQSARRWALAMKVPQQAIDLVFPEGQVIDRLFVALRDRGVLWVAVFRCMPILRSIISLPAGMMRMPVLKFTAWSAAGITTWSFLWIWVGYSLRENWHRPGGRLYNILIGVFCLVVIIVARSVAKNYHNRDR